MELYLFFPRTRSLRGQGQLHKSVLSLRTMDARTCEVEATTVLQKHSADLETGVYIHVY